MIHSEKMKMAGGTIEIRHNNDGDAVYVFIKRKRAKVYPSFESMISSVYFGAEVEHFKCTESELFSLYESNHYDYKKLKKRKENPDNPNQLKLWQ